MGQKVPYVMQPPEHNRPAKIPTKLSPWKIYHILTLQLPPNFRAVLYRGNYAMRLMYISRFFKCFSHMPVYCNYGNWTAKALVQIH